MTFQPYLSFIHRQKLLLAVFLITVLFQLFPANWQAVLSYDRQALAQGEIWRLFTAHFVHLSWTHLLYNSIALAVFIQIFAEMPPVKPLLMCFIVLCVSAGLWFLNPGIQGYAGFSGVLSGLFIIGSLQSFSRDWFLSLAVGLTVGGKVIYEQLQGSQVVISAVSQIPTVVDAHFYGVLAAAFFYGISQLNTKRNV